MICKIKSLIFIRKFIQSFSNMVSTNVKFENDEIAINNIITKMNSNLSASKPIPVIGILTKSVLEEERPITDFREIIEPKYLFLLQDAIVIPISLYFSDAEMLSILKKVNGVCLPGGHTNIWTSTTGLDKRESEYTKAGKRLIKLALELNKNGNYFPILGICLGFELLAAAIGETLDIVEPCEFCCNYCTTLEYCKESQDAKILKAFSEEQLKKLQNEKLSFNYHSFMIDYDKFIKNKKLNEFFRVVSLSPSQENHFKFVSTIEARNYPFYAVQHHPEWSFHDFYFPKTNVICNSDTVNIGKSLGNFFLNEARKNKNEYLDKVDLKNKLLVNGKSYLDESKGYVFLFNPAK